MQDGIEEIETIHQRQIGDCSDWLNDNTPMLNRKSYLLVRMEMSFAGNGSR